MAKLHRSTKDPDVFGEEDLVVMGPTTFEGRNVWSFEQRTVAYNQQYRELGEVEYLFKFYYLADSAAATVRAYGLYNEGVRPPSDPVVTSIEADGTGGYDQNPGESRSYSYTATTRYPDGSTTTTTGEPRVVTYVGREVITVPAGTFDTCRIETTGTDDHGEDHTSVAWLHVGTGIGIKTSNGSLELLSVTVNGVPLQ